MLKINKFIIACAVVGMLYEPVIAQTNDAASEPTYTLGSNELDIIKLIQTVAAATGKTMVIDPSVKGKVKIMTNHNELTKDELYELFRTVLEISNYTVVEVGDVTRVIPLKDARTSPLGDASGRQGNAEFVTDVIQLENIAATKVLTILRPLVAQHASISAHDTSNSIVLTDTLANIARIRQLIKKIDTAAVPTTEVVQLRYAEADSLVATLTKIGASDKAAAGLSNKLQLVADARNNAILISGEDLQRERTKALISRLDRPQAQTGNVRVVYLEYADAVQVAETLTKVVQNMSKLTIGTEPTEAAGATVEADEATNALLITAAGDSLNSLLAVVDRLDIRRAQVLVEAIIVDMSVTDNESFGVEWLFANSEDGIFGGSINSGNVASAAPVLDSSSSISDIASGIVGVGQNSLGIAGTSGDDNFLGLLTALVSSSKANVLSTPSLMTLDNNEATISSGRNIPFTTGSFATAGGDSVNPFTTTTREDVGIILTVTPQVNEGDKVLLNISQEVSDIGEQVAGTSDFITTKSTIDTQILAQDGEIVVLGGLMRESVTDGENKVPLLGSIPILGHLFKFQEAAISKTNLMIFLRAKIIRDDEQMYGATAEKYKIIREAQIEQRKLGLALMDDGLLPVLPELERRTLVKPDSDDDSDKANDLDCDQYSRKSASRKSCLAKQRGEAN